MPNLQSKFYQYVFVGVCVCVCVCVCACVLFGIISGCRQPVRLLEFILYGYLFLIPHLTIAGDTSQLQWKYFCHKHW
jgi:hypothetical protein